MNKRIKKIENMMDGKWITYFATSEGFNYDTALEVIKSLTENNEVETFQVYALLFFGYGHEVIKESIDKIEEYLETFIEYKLTLSEIQYCKNTKDIVLLFE